MSLKQFYFYFLVKDFFLAIVNEIVELIGKAKRQLMRRQLFLSSIFILQFNYIEKAFKYRMRHEGEVYLCMLILF